MSEHKPEAVAEEPEHMPGGADSLDDPKYGDTPGDPVPRDLDPEANPAVDESAPEEVKEADDKQQAPDAEESEDLDPGSESGDSEPPA